MDDSWKNCRLYIAVTANHDYLYKDFVVNLERMIKPAQCMVGLEGQHIKSGSLNGHVEKAFDHKCDKIFFVDVDMQFPPWTIPKLLSHKLDIVGGQYHLKSKPFAPVAGWHDKDGKGVNGQGKPWKDHYFPLPQDTLVEVDWTGVGCLMVDLEVFNKIWFPCFRDTWDDEKGIRAMGHDVVFCKAAKQAGYKIYIDTNVDCGHISKIMINRYWAEMYNRYDVDSMLHEVTTAYASKPCWWDEIWRTESEQHVIRGAIHLLDVIIPLVPYGSSVADLGCGDGGIIRGFRAITGSPVVGYDFSKESIRRLEEAGVPGKLADLRTFTPSDDERFHTVVCSHVLEHLTEDEAKHVVWAASTMCTHQAIFITPDNEYPPHIEHKQTVDEKKMLSWVRGYFDEVDIMRAPYARAKNLNHLIAVCKKAVAKGESLTSAAA